LLTQKKKEHNMYVNTNTWKNSKILNFFTVAEGSEQTS
jgi:hypothetical protein